MENTYKELKSTDKDTVKTNQCLKSAELIAKTEGRIVTVQD